MKTASRGPRPLDRTDRLILKCLQEDGRLSNVALARKVNLTPTPCLERVRRLERDGFIKGLHHRSQTSVEPTDPTGHDHVPAVRRGRC